MRLASSVLAASIAGVLAVTLPAATGGDRSPPAADENRAPAPLLPARGPLARRRAMLGDGPRADWRFASQRSRSGRRIGVNLFGNGRARSKLLVAGCVNGGRCAGEQVVAALADDCPPTDAEFWLMPTLRPEGADLDARPRQAGAAALRQSVADLRPTLTVIYRSGPRPIVRAEGAGLTAGREYAQLTGIPLASSLRPGLASWTERALRGAGAITIELPSARLRRLGSLRHAYALERLAGTRFARPVPARRDGRRRDRSDFRRGELLDALRSRSVGRS